MDYFIQQAEKLAKQASEITMYDINSAVNKAKNMVLNLSEIETKVREATNDDAWGASSTVMQEIAQATFNFQLFNEIMPTIYQRFTEKEARQWRQIYKSLVLLEYLVKNGSERVIDDARTHLSLIKVLRNFHYTDDAGKDQGINVRNRSKELAELLGDLDRVRQERRKAKANRNKYTGVGNDGSGGGPSFTSASGSRYGGFGSDSMEGGGGGGGGGGSSGGGRSSGFNDHNQQTAEYEEYDAGDWEDSDRRGNGNGSSSHSGGNNSNGARAAESRAAAHNSRGTSSSSRTTTKSTPAPPAPLPPKQKEVNLFDFDDEEQQPAVPAKIVVPEIQTANLDDDFDDFQSASPAPSTTSLPPKNVFDLLKANQQQSAVPLPSYQQPSLSSFAPLQAQSRSPINNIQTQLYPQPPSSSSSSFVSSPVLSPMNSRTSSSPAPSNTSTKSAGGAADFSDLFTSFNISSSTSTGAPKQTIAQLSAKTNQDKLFATSGSNKPNNGNNGGAGSMSGWDSLI